MESAATPSLSIVIPARDGWDTTFRCLLAVARHSNGARPQTLVVDDGTSDETRLALGHLEGVIGLRNESPGGFARACNQGAASADGEVVVLLDREVEVSSGWLAPIARAFADPKVAAAVPSSDSGAAGAYVAVRAAAFREVGGLDEGRPDAIEAMLGRFIDVGARVELIADARARRPAGGGAPAPRDAAPGPGPGRAPPQELLALQRTLQQHRAALVGAAQTFLQRFPADRDAQFLFAEAAHAAQQDELALRAYRDLARDCPPNERLRVEQGVQGCQTDRSYFPPVFAERLSTAEYAEGHNAERWRDYAWKEIQRGREIVRMIRGVTPLRGKRVLDVGSGYGGMLISMAEQGAAAVGVEIDGERAGMSRLRLQELGMDVPVHLGDICEPATGPRLGGPFDVVVCQDVLEHVLEPEVVIASLCGLLRPGGVLYVQIPNKFGADQLLSDHHYALTGLTALSRAQAIEYWSLATGHAPEHYTVGYERTEPWYQAAFARGGVRIAQVQEYGSIHHLRWYADSFSAMVERLKQPIHPALPPRLEARIRRRMSLAVLTYHRGLERAQALPEGSPAQARLCDLLVRRIGLGLWRFLGVKEA